MVAIVEPAPLGGRPGGLRALGPAGGDHRPGHRAAGHRHPHRARTGAARSMPTAGPSPAPSSWPGCRPAPWRRRRSSSTASRAPRRAAGRPRLPAHPRIPWTCCRCAARTRARCSSPSSARRTSRRATRSSSSTTPTSSPTPWPRPGRGAAVLRIKGTTKALVATTDGNAPVGALDPWLGAAMSVAEAARNVSITGRAAPGRHQLPQLRRPHAPGGVLAARRGRPRPRRRVHGAGPARHRRQRLALQRGARARRSRRRPRSASWGCWRTSRRSSGRRSAATTTRSCSSASRRRASPAPSTRAWPAPRVEDGPPPLDLERERSLQAFIREAIARGLVESCQDVSGGGFAVAVAEMCIWGDRGALLRLPVGDSPAVALFGESPSRLVVRGAPAPRCRRSSCSPASTASPCTPSGTTGGTRLRVDLAGEGATGAAEERGSRIADALDVARRGPAARVGARASRGRWAGRAPGRTTTSPTPRSRVPRWPADVRRRRGRPAQPRPRGRGGGGDGAVRAPAPGPGVGRRRGLRRRRT